MTISETKITREIADAAREDVEEYNKDVISKARAGGTTSILRLRADDSLQRLQKAFKEFRSAFETSYPNTTIVYAQPVLFLRLPTMEPVTMNARYGCLALGKIGGGEAEELKTGRALVWEPGEKHIFGDIDAIYVGFKLFEKSA